MVSITPKSRILSNGTANDATPVEQNFTELYNNDTLLANVVTLLETTSLSTSQLKNINTTSCPIYTNDNSFSVMNLFCSNAVNDGFLVKTLPTIVDLNTTDLNGIAVSSNQNGTIIVNEGTNSVAGISTTFTTTFQVGDIIRTNGGQARRIISVNSNTSLNVESNWSVTETSDVYKRGGRAPNTWYHLYAIGNGSTGNFLLSTRNTSANEQLLDLPTGYNRQRQLAFSIKTDTNGNILPFKVAHGWPSAPFILYDLENYYILNGSSTGFSAVNTSAYVPVTSRVALVDFGISAAGNIYNQAFIRNVGSSGSGRVLGVPVNTPGVNQRIQQLVGLNNLGQFEYRVLNAATALDAAVVGFAVTEVV